MDKYAVGFIISKKININFAINFLPVFYVIDFVITEMPSCGLCVVECRGAPPPQKKKKQKQNMMLVSSRGLYVVHGLLFDEISADESKIKFKNAVDVICPGIGHGTPDRYRVICPHP